MTKLADRRYSGGIPASALAPSDPVAVAASATKLMAARQSVGRGELVDLPGLGPAWIELIGHSLSNRVEAATFKAMEAEGLPPVALHGWSYDMERYARTLAHAARDPDDPTHQTPFGTLEQWRDEDDDVIFACSLVYKDVKNRLDPSGQDHPVTEEDADEMMSALKKKDGPALRRFGVSMLVSWLLSGAVQPSTSPTPASNTGPSTPE